jgi:hypothetical protein
VRIITLTFAHTFIEGRCGGFCFTGLAAGRLVSIAFLTSQRLLRSRGLAFALLATLILTDVGDAPRHHPLIFFVNHQNPLPVSVEGGASLRDYQPK